MLKVFALAALIALSAAYEKDGDVVVLTDDDFDAAIKEHDFILVEFYAPWCGHCKSLEPEYAKAATALSKLDTPITIAKVDATENSECASKHEVRGYPTLKWFVRGEAQEYTGGRTADTIVSWIKKKTGPPCKTLADAEATEAFIAGADVVVIAFLAADSADLAVVEAVAQGIEDVEFGLVSDAAVATANGAKLGDVVLFKKFDEGKAVFEGTLAADELKQFVAAKSSPLVHTFTQETAPKIFGSGVDNHFLYFNHADSATHTDTMAVMTAVAEEFLLKTLFVFVPSTEDRVMNYFDLTADDLPAAVLVSMGDGDMKKYAFSKDITAENVKAHVEAFHAGELSPTLKSEEIPEDNNGPVTVIVGKNFEDVVLDDSKHVFVEFYAPWCGHCKSLAPTWEELGEKFAGADNVVIAKVDATANDIDHPGLSVKGFPTLVFFPAGGKAEPLTYDGGRDIDALTAYVEEKSGATAGAAAAGGHAHDDL